MGKLTTFGLMAFACCATLTVAMGYGAGGMMGAGMMGGNMMYNRYPYMGGMGMTGGMGMKGGMMSPMVMPMPGYGGYGGGYGGGRGFSPVGQGGIMQFFFMCKSF